MIDLAVDLLDGEQLMSDADELAFRQIAPHMLIDNGQVASTAFGPMPSDNYMPSYSRSSIVTAQDARDWFDQNARSESHGVWGVTVGEVIAANRYVVDDSECPLPPGKVRAPGHCFVDFRGLTRPQRKELQAQLLMHATERGEIPTVATPQDGRIF